MDIKKFSIITWRHESFLKTYLGHPSRYIRFNGTRSYLEIYPRANYRTATTNSSKLLKRHRKWLDKLWEETKMKNPPFES